MEIVAGTIGLLVGALAVGAVARFALPGPDPLPVWTTIALGFAGAFVGGLAFGVAGLLPEDPSAPEATGAYFLAAVAGATFVLLLYRLLVQKRPIVGPDAQRHPRRRDEDAP